MKVYYLRVSTNEQNLDRQQIGISSEAKVFEDKCSGTILFKERPKASALINLIEQGLVNEIIVHSIDRLGRNTLDILQTIQYMTDNNVCVTSNKEGLKTIIDGKPNPMASLLIGILSTLSEWELNKTKERQKEGIQEAHKRGAYKNNGGYKQNEAVEDFLNKPKSKEVIKYLKEGQSTRRCAKLTGCSLGLVQKVKGTLESLEIEKQRQNTKTEIQPLIDREQKMQDYLKKLKK
jgi:DNA invertase Pin-like site-specific DNA recombinase